MNFKSWTDSKISCAVNKSQLLVIQDKAELDFIQSKIHDGVYFWIGLNVPDTQKRWTWLDDTPLYPQLFQVTSQVEDNACALITLKVFFLRKVFHSQLLDLSKFIYRGRHLNDHSYFSYQKRISYYRDFYFFPRQVKQGLTMQPWLFWNSCRPGWPQIHRYPTISIS